MWDDIPRDFIRAFHPQLVPLPDRPLQLLDLAPNFAELTFGPEFEKRIPIIIPLVLPLVEGGLQDRFHFHPDLVDVYSATAGAC